MPPRPRSETDSSAGEHDPLAARFDALEERIDRLAETVEQFANVQIPSPAALDALEIRLQAVEERPEPVDYGDESSRPQAESRPPAAKLCPECGGPELGPHFDDCSIGHGEDARPKAAAAREAAERRERRNA